MRNRTRVKSSGTIATESSTANRFGNWGTRVQIGASLLIVLHLLAILAEPLHFFSRSPVRSSAPDTGWLRYRLARYVDFLYLDHGYFFFAPNPGPNHLIECRMLIRAEDVEAGANNKPHGRLDDEIVTLPSHQLHRPRLLYHRYFMLAEFYNTLYTPAELPAELGQNPVIAAQWRLDCQRYLGVQQSLLKHLQSEFPGREVQVDRIEHQLPNENQVLGEGWRLDDSRLYITMPH